MPFHVVLRGDQSDGLQGVDCSRSFELIPRIKTILLNQYIGAIAIGYLVGRAVEAFFAGVMQTLNTMLTEIFRGREFIDKEPWIVARVAFISNLVLVILYLAVAFFLASWLYPGTKQEKE